MLEVGEAVMRYDVVRRAGPCAYDLDEVLCMDVVFCMNVLFMDVVFCVDVKVVC